MTEVRRVYGYTHPGQASAEWTRTVGSVSVSGVGRIKVGQTSVGTGTKRIREQTQITYPDWSAIRVYFDQPAQRNDGTWFTDHAIHRLLEDRGIKRAGEWFEATEAEVLGAIAEAKAGKTFSTNRTLTYRMRPEQAQAVRQTADYYLAQAGDLKALRYLWNAKMRFGKTFTTYQLAVEMGWSRVLVLTFKPAVGSAWRNDLLGHADFDGWTFIDRDHFPESFNPDQGRFVWFASLQDALGKTVDGGVKYRNEWIHLIEWDAIVIDEYHFGAWRDAAKSLYDPTESALAEEEQAEPLAEDMLSLTARHRLFLSGTPFRALTDGEFAEDQIFNWTYIDEQRAKGDWDETTGPNPYAPLPQMEMYTYQVSDSALAEAAEGEFDGFDLNAYFKAAKVGEGYRFSNETRVLEFLNMLRGKLTEQMKAELVSGYKPPFPFEDARFNGKLDHTVWYLPDVGSCHAMANLLHQHPYFRDFGIHVAAGGKAGLGEKALPPIQKLIDQTAQTITLSCGKLMTGVTVPQWSGILMLRSLKSPESYFQAAFRIQSPWTIRTNAGKDHIRKQTVFVFDFDPNRALSLVAEYGSKIATLGEQDPKSAITDLINFLPIYAFDGSSLTQLDATEALDWATSGTGASMLARRWRDARLVDLNEAALTRLLANEELVSSLEQMEDFRNLSAEVSHIISSTKGLEKAKAEHGGRVPPDRKPEHKETASKRKLLREKLLKFLSRIPVFMYLTDFREEALQHIIEALDPELFERVTGLTVKDFKALKDAGVFNASHMNAAIYAFKRYEDSSLRYVSDQIGLWDHSVRRSELEAMTPEEAAKAVELG